MSRGKFKKYELNFEEGFPHDFQGEHQSYLRRAWNKPHRCHIPKETDLIVLARELDCSVMDFFADEEDIPPVKPRDEDEEDILRIYRGLSRRAKHEFMSMAYEFENREELKGDSGETTELRKDSAV